MSASTPEICTRDIQQPAARRAPAAHRLVLAACLAALAALALPRAASAQQVAVIVNGSPITTYDIEQRIKFQTLATPKAPTRAQVIEELIDEKLKVQIGQRYKLEITDSQVDAAFANMAQRMRMSADQLTKALATSGVDAGTLKSRIRSDIAWQQIVRGKFQSSLQIREKDVFAKVAANKQDEKKDVGYEYVLRPILFIVPPGSSEQILDGRKREAEQFRARFENCSDGLNFARALRDVAVREQIVKSSADLDPALRKILDDVPVGKLTSPEVTPQGVQMFALCARKENSADAAATKEARDALFAAEFQDKSKRYLQILRKSAMIEVK